METTSSNSTGDTTFDGEKERDLLYKENDHLRLIPAPSDDPKDPLNLPLWHKLIGLGSICCFGALAASAELILGSMIPVFALQYAGINPKVIARISANGFPEGTDPEADLQNLPHAPPIWKIQLLASLPVLVMGVANLFMIPLAIAIGRRPLLLSCGLVAIAGAVWAGNSQSLGSHIVARCFQAIGAGTIESLIPYIVQDTVFFHQRNTAMSGVFAAQGIIIIGLGISSPHIILTLGWRYIYFITAAGAGLFLVMIFFLMPETRWHRSRDELNGFPRPTYSTAVDKLPRTIRYNLSLMHGGLQWHNGWNALLDSLRTFYYPHIFFITLLNSVLLAALLASAYTTSAILLTAPYSWPFLNLGLSQLALLAAGVCVAIICGGLGDRVSSVMAKKRGRRLPENQLINLILPTICSLIGSILFGLAGQYPDRYPWPVFLLGLGFEGFGYLGTNAVGAVYVLESYPQLAGPALVDIASFRSIIAFLLTFRVSDIIIQLGYLRSMAIYTALIGAFAMFLPVLYIWGPVWRRRWPGPDR